MARSWHVKHKQLLCPRLLNVIGLLSFIIMIWSNLEAQQLAFPGAEGYGRFTTGGRGGEVIEVTNLNDSGPGSFRAAVRTSGPRTIVFRVSGNITLESRLDIKYGNLTIAGQTAPGDGVCVRNYDLKVEASNVIIRHMRFRLGDTAGIEADALQGPGENNIIIDHCSVSWSVDECMSFYGGQNVTIQWCLISESLHNSVHSKGPHGYGGIWGGTNCSFHHNMFAHHTSRTPRFNEGDRESAGLYDRNVDHRNNVIYNWGGNSAYSGKSGWYNLVNNYYKYGPATGPKSRIVEPWDDKGKWYVEGNYVHGYPDITTDNWAGGVDFTDVDRIRVYEPHAFAPVLTHTAENAYEVVLADVGASLKRDLIDSRIVYEARHDTAFYGGAYTGPGTGIIDTQDDVGGWPELLTYEVPVDIDHDGMADEWEVAHGLDTTDASDRNEDFNGDGYTNLEKYLNSLCERTDFLLAPAELTALTLSHESINLRWKENTLNEGGFSIERSEGDTSSFAEIATAGPGDTVYTDTGLEALTTYFYRVRAYNGQVQSIPTNLAETTTLDTSGVPFQVKDPLPTDGTANVSIETIFEWSAAIGAASYDVYLGTSNPPPFRVRQSATEYELRDLQDATTYYWRIDAVNDSGITTGDVWQFTTESFSEALIAYWPFERGSGTLEVDSTGNGHFVYLKNMYASTAAVDGPYGLGLQFNGADQYLMVRNSELLDISVRGFSVTFWLELSDTSLTAPLLSKGIYSEGNLDSGYEICYTGSGRLRFSVGDGERVSVIKAVSSSIFPDDWVMVTAIRDRFDDSLKLYADTTLLASVPDSTWNLSQMRDLFMAGNLQTGRYLKGALDEVRIHNYALDATEIRDLYLEGIVSIEPKEVVTLPRSLELEAYPNPFNSVTTIIYTVPRTGNVQLTVYNLLGQEVGSLVDGYTLAGKHALQLNGNLFASGIYYLRLNNQDQVRIRKLMLIK